MVKSTYPYRMLVLIGGIQKTEPSYHLPLSFISNYIIFYVTGFENKIKPVKLLVIGTEPDL